jgi:hypothetical protein
MFSKILFFLACFAYASAAKDPQCGLPCVTNNDCLPSLECSRCYHGVCSAGLACGSQDCLVNTDCNQNGNCTACSSGVCTRFCGQSCKTDEECVSHGCTQCAAQTNTCVSWQCGALCYGDATCNLGYLGCNFCDQRSSTQPGVCKSSCGTACTHDTQCPRRCPFCTNQTCGLFPPS